MDTLVNEGVKFIFGNPGTTELPILEALNDYPEIRYIMALHEGIAVSMADAYAHCSGEVGVVNLHVGPGLGNGLGSVYNAWEGRTPLVVTAGQQDSRMRLRDPLLGHDLVAMAKPLVKWSVEPTSADELSAVMHKAFKTAREEPSGPVFVSLPINIMDQRSEKGALLPSRLHNRFLPEPAAIEAVSEHLRTSQNPVVFFGDKIAQYGAFESLVALTELIGAKVFAEFLPSRINFPNQHPQFAGRAGQDYRMIAEQTKGADIVLLIGGEFFEEVWFTDNVPFPEDATIIQIDPDIKQLGRNIRVDHGLIGCPKLTLTALHSTVLSGITTETQKEIQERRQRMQIEKKHREEKRRELVRTPESQLGLSTAMLMEELRLNLPKDIAIAGEPITAGVDMLKTLSFDAPDDYLASRGGGIGQGLPSAIGMKLAQPDRPVLCLSGDGSSLYSIQTLWSAVHHEIPIVFLILNNRTYRILKLNMNRYRSEAQLPDRGYQHLDLSNPNIDYVNIAKGFGMNAVRVTKSDALAGAVSHAFETNESWLIDVLVDGSI